MIRTSHKLLLVSSIAVMTMGLTSGAQAAGFYLQEQSASGLGNAFAGSGAQPRDASVIFFNPAGMTYLEGGNANLGVHVLVPKSSISDEGTTLPAGAPGSTGDGGNPYSVTPIPNAYISQQVTDQLWLGLGISAPFGLSGEFDDGWFGRYDSTETHLTTIDVTPSVAFKVNNWLSVGGGLIIQHADAELKNNIFVTTEGEQTLKGNDTSVGFKAGVLVEPMKGTRLGLDYRSEIKHTLEGRLIIEGSGGGDANIVGRADLALPSIATFSAAQDVNDRLTVMGSVTHFGWDSFDEIQVQNILNANVGAPIVQDYQNTWAYSVGFDYKLDDQWTVRAGYQYDETPTTDEFRTSRTPDGDRHWFSGGTTYKLNDQWSFDLSGTYIHIEDEEINLQRNIAANPSNVVAETEGHVIIVSGGLNYKF
jgi:long-chain fatty acid transport protein